MLTEPDRNRGMGGLCARDVSRTAALIVFALP